MPSWKVKRVGGISMQWVTTLIENDNWEKIVGRCHAHGGTEFSIDSCIPSKYTNQGKISRSSFHQKSLPYQPNHFSFNYQLGILWVWTMGYKDDTLFAGYLMTLLGIWTYTLAFPCVSQGFLFKALKGHVEVLGPWCWLFLVWPFSQKWHRFLLAMGELGKPLIILPFVSCPLC